MALPKICLFCLLWPACALAQKTPLFQLLPPAQTGVGFQNTLVENSETDNVLAYEYYYNGGGVAIGDLDNDGLPELFFTANREQNALYHNLGNLAFKDITKTAGVGGRRKGWKTGVTLADVNADGWLDIYVCYSGRGDDDDRRNQLWINNKNLTFTEQAKAFGLDDPGYATQAAFFDFDNDGDLDCFLLNHNIGEYRNFENDEIRHTRDPLAGDKLLENRSGRFVDVSESAGIPANPLGFGLGVAVFDANADGWYDVYVSNDYNEPDYLLLNDGRGHFTDAAPAALGHMSHFSMGCDAADLNNDGRPDLLTLDMLPPDNRRQKLLQGPENYEVYDMMVKTGRHRQFMRNMLQLNATGNPDAARFAEIGQLAGLANTDWSWSALIADFDNDGWKDVFITNGYLRDYTNRDFLRYWGDYLVKKAAASEPPSLLELVRKMPASRLKNFLFRNDGADSLGRPKLTFSDMTDAWGAPQTAVSNGAAYADLDADGDLEIVVSNINEPAFIYKNLARETNGNQFIQFQFVGNQQNTRGVGTKMRIRHANGEIQYAEMMTVRGYQSTVPEVLHFGLGDGSREIVRIEMIKADTVVHTWGSVRSGYALTNRRNVLDLGKLVLTPPLGVADTRPALHFSQSTLPANARGDAFRHEEYDYNDFKRQPLLPHMLSRVGPVLAAGDVNTDGLDDLFVGASKWQTSRLFLQNKERAFVPADSTMFRAEQFMTVADAQFFDADADGDLDLYLVAGGYADYAENDPALNDALYFNDGQGRFARRDSVLPDMTVAKSCVRPFDFDADGDPDLFIGGRVIPGKYPLPPRSFLLENDGTGRFHDVTAQQAPVLLQPGMVSDAAWADLDADGAAELVLCGEWMPIRVFGRNAAGIFEEKTGRFFSRNYAGLWNCLLADDLDGDGDTDLVGGNLGLNSQLKASEKEPATLVYKDFDGNGSIDPILCFYIQGKSYPFLTRDELLDQITAMRPRFTSYEQFAGATLTDMFRPEELAGAQTLTATHLATTFFENEGGRLVEKPLPVEAQFAPVFVASAFRALPYNDKQLLLAGNLDGARLRFGCYDAGRGAVLRLREGRWQYEDSRFDLRGDVRSFLPLRGYRGAPLYVVGINNDFVKILKPK